jgi:nucleoside-diphosphate-sugar epimerase
MMTGATGYVGSHVVKLLLSQGHAVGSMERFPKRTPKSVTSFIISKESKPDLIKNAFDSFSPDIVLHLAAKWSSNSDADSIGEYLNANLNFPKQVVLESIRRGSRFFNICSYWQMESYILTKGENQYVSTKNQFRRLAEELSLLHKDKISNIYLFDNYGPLDWRGKVISTLVENAKRRLPTILRAPNIELNLLHIDDVARGIVQLVAEEDVKPNYEISNSSTTNLGQCVDAIELVFSEKLDVVWLDDKPVQNKAGLHDRLFPVPYGWAPKIDLIEGIRTIKDAG